MPPATTDGRQHGTKVASNKPASIPRIPDVPVKSFFSRLSTPAGPLHSGAIDTWTDKSADDGSARAAARRFEWNSSRIDSTVGNYPCDGATPHPSKMATARVQPAEAPRIFTGKQHTVKPSPGKASRLCSFSRWQ